MILVSVSTLWSIHVFAAMGGRSMSAGNSSIFILTNADSSENVQYISISNGFKFEPKRVTIRVGDTVEWKNKTKEVHTVTDIPDSANYPKDVAVPPGAEPFSSGGIMPGDTYRHTFTIPGKYKYFCKLHEVFHMTGEITVKPAGK